MPPRTTLRRRPVQARSRETFDRILDHAAKLIDEVGWEGFNTNALAGRAGIGLQTLYRYFPNKLAVAATLAERMTGEWSTWFGDFDELRASEPSLEALWSHYVDTFVSGVRSMPGGMAVRRAMAAVPELHEIDQADNDRFARRLAGALRRERADLSGQRAYAIARTLVESAVSVIDTALTSSPARSRRLLAELKSMQVAYLREILAEDDGPRSQSHPRR